MSNPVIIQPSQFWMAEPDNPFYPLPKDYEDLTVDGKRQARIAAVSDQSTPLKMVAAWDCFRRMYLIPTEPGFFYHDYKESPSFHYEMIYDAGDCSRNVQMAPRGFAKSVIIGTELPLMLLLTRKYIRIVLSLATDSLVEGRFEQIITQLVENPFIREDFGVQKPARGSAIWNRHYIHLVNGSQMEGFSVMGKKRGARPDLFILDDPEFDKEGQTAAETIRAMFETMLFRQVIPMLENGSSIFWIGTNIGVRSFINHAVYGGDARFDYWNRKVYEAETTDDLGHRIPLWESKWNLKALEIREGEIGKDNYMREYRNRVASEDEGVLHIDPTLNEYTISDVPDIHVTPNSTGTVTYSMQDKLNGPWVQKTQAITDIFGPMYKVLTFDPARGLKAHNDYSCVAIVGFDKFNCMWVLDMWMGRARELQLLKMIWTLGLKWQVKVLGIESVSMQVSLLDSVSTYLDQHAGEAGSWAPRIVPVDYEGVRKDKASRIATLEWRFEQGKIKYPANRKDKWPFSMLYSQTEDFTYDLSMLPHDDAIDAVAMAHFIIHGKGIQKIATMPERTLDKMLEHGQMEIGGLPIINAFGTVGLTPKMIAGIERRGIDPNVDPAYNGYRRRCLKIGQTHGRSLRH